ncbi:MAG: hypothetical protein QOE84_3733 [Actinomycetota bacterium]|jgi:hypothetical protein|nr:hypothetical protein [Actinomycetota bacterium]
MTIDTPDLAVIPTQGSEPAHRVPLGALDLTGYTVTDTAFGAPWIDIDEWRETPAPHRHVHGGFTGTNTRFTFYFVPEADYQGRMLCPLEGAHGGHEDSFGGPMGEIIGGLRMSARLGAFMMESNQGHIGDDLDPAFGEDNTIYGGRANTEAGRLGRFLAEQVYGEAPHHSYVWGGSGGGRRSPGNLEYGGDLWAGALPFMGGGNIVEHGDTSLVKSSQPSAFGAMFNVQRLLKGAIAQVTDATAPGGSGNPYDGLTTHQREELANLYRLGYPRGDEFMIGQPMGQIWLWSSMADDYQVQDPSYFESFWTKPGYVGHDAPQHVQDDLIDVQATVKRVITARTFIEAPEEFSEPKWELLKTMVTLMAGTGEGLDLPVAVELEGLSGGYRLGAGLKVVSGEAAGRQLYAVQVVDDVFQGDGVGEANLLRFSGVQVGDTIHVDNRAFLAFCYHYRHHVTEDVQFDFLKLDGVPIYPQHTIPTQSPLMGIPYSGKYDGKLLWVHHTHDASLWPPQGLLYQEAVRRSQGEKGLDESFCLRWSENAEHIPPYLCPSDPGRASATWLIDYMPIIEQSLVDLIAWCERGDKPVGTAFSYEDGKLVLPATAAERKGIQPVVSVTVDGSERADVTAGTPVTLQVLAEVPPGAGTITSVAWDIDGTGAFPISEEVDGTQTRLELSRTQVYDRPGTYFVTARVTSRRDGDVTALDRQLPNLAQVRVVVS